MEFSGKLIKKYLNIYVNNQICEDLLSDEQKTLKMVEIAFPLIWSHDLQEMRERFSQIIVDQQNESHLKETERRGEV